MSIITTNAEVFADIDPDHCIAEIRRMGGGFYRMFIVDGSQPDKAYSEIPEEIGGTRNGELRRGFLTYQAAVTYADELVRQVEGDPAVTMESLALKKAQNRTSELEARMAEMQDQFDKEIRQANTDRSNYLTRIDGLERALDAEIAKADTNPVER